MPNQTTGELVDHLRDHLGVSKVELARLVNADRMKIGRTLDGPRERDKPGAHEQLLGACLLALGARLVRQGEALEEAANAPGDLAVSL